MAGWCCDRRCRRLDLPLRARAVTHRSAVRGRRCYVGWAALGVSGAPAFGLVGRGLLGDAGEHRVDETGAVGRGRVGASRRASGRRVRWPMRRCHHRPRHDHTSRTQTLLPAIGKRGGAVPDFGVSCTGSKRTTPAAPASRRGYGLHRRALRIPGFGPRCMDVSARAGKEPGPHRQELRAARFGGIQGIQGVHNVLDQLDGRAADGTCLAKVGSCATLVTIRDWMASVEWQFFWFSASTPRPSHSLPGDRRRNRTDARDTDRRRDFATICSWIAVGKRPIEVAGRAVILDLSLVLARIAILASLGHTIVGDIAWIAMFVVLAEASFRFVERPMRGSFRAWVWYIRPPHFRSGSSESAALALTRVLEPWLPVWVSAPRWLTILRVARTRT